MDLAFSVSGGQVWADNCQVCVAETDDYRLYCLSQAQSTLIQQSHLYLIYESLSHFLTSSVPLISSLIFASSYVAASRESTFEFTVFTVDCIQYQSQAFVPCIQQSGQE